MFNLRKFYDMALAESASTTETTEQSLPSEQSQPSLASLMAKGGTKKIDIDQPSIINTTTKSSEKSDETNINDKNEKPVEPTTTQAKIVEKVELETPQKQEEKKEEKPTPSIEAAAQKPELTLQEVLKQQPKTEVLKVMGYDEKVISFMEDLKDLDPKVLAFLETYKTGGDLTSYLREWTTDYKKMPAEEVMRHQLRSEYPTASDRAIEALYKKEVIKNFNLDSEDPDEAEEGKLLLEAKADKFRSELIKNQQNHLFPAPKAKEPDNTAEQEQVQAQQKIESYKAKIESDPYSKDVFDKGKIIIGEGSDAFNWLIDKESIRGILYDSSKWAETQFDITKDADGKINYTPKTKDQILTAAFAKNPQKFLKDFAEHFKSLGGKETIEPIQNAKKLDVEKPSQQAVKSDTSMASQMAKGGTISQGGGYN